MICQHVRNPWQQYDVPLCVFGCHSPACDSDYVARPSMMATEDVDMNAAMPDLNFDSTLMLTFSTPTLFLWEWKKSFFSFFVISFFFSAFVWLVFQNVICLLLFLSTLHRNEAIHLLTKWKWKKKSLFLCFVIVYVIFFFCSSQRHLKKLKSFSRCLFWNQFPTTWGETKQKESEIIIKSQVCVCECVCETFFLQSGDKKAQEKKLWLQNTFRLSLLTSFSFIGISCVLCPFARF